MTPISIIDQQEIYGFQAEKQKAMERERKSTVKSTHFNHSNSYEFDPTTDICIHGLANIVHTGSIFEKTFWVLVFLIGVSGFTYYLVQIIAEYLDRPVLISLETISLPTMQVPDITICFEPLPMLDRNRSAMESVWYTVINLQDEPLAVAKLEEIIGVETMSGYYDIDWRTVLRQHGPQCNQSLLRCAIGFKNFDCCDMFRSVDLTEGSSCFTVNDLAKFGEQVSPRPELGLQLLIKCPNQVGGGILLGFPMLYNGIVASCGTETEISLYTTLIVRHPERKGGCIANKKELVSRDANCQVAMFDVAMQKICKCTLNRMVVHALHVHNEPNATMCNPIWYYVCLGRHNDELQAKFTRQANLHCLIDPCFTWEFQPTPTAVQLRNDRVDDMLQISGASASEYILLSIFHPVLGYKEFDERIAMSFDALIGAIGGQMGLFLGASMISVIQILGYLYHKVKSIKRFRSETASKTIAFP